MSAYASNVRGIPIAGLVIVVAACAGPSSGGPPYADGEDGTHAESSDGGSEDDSSASEGGTQGGTDESGAGVRFDVLGLPDSPACGGDIKQAQLSFIWIANSTQGTLTQLDTQTLVERGRYLTRPDGQGKPSRTSVNLSGDAVVANRHGGITKMHALPERCVEQNGVPGIQTSENDEWLAWDDEECRAWHRPMNFTSQRPVAWTAGSWNEGACEREDEHVWTAGTNIPGSAEVSLLDGEDGSTVQKTFVTGLPQNIYGIYGAAVDQDDNFWGSTLGSGGKLVFVDREDFSYQLWDTPTGPHWYGMTVDSEGYVWVCSETVGRFDPQTETFEQAVVGGHTGCMAEPGPAGRLWLADTKGLIAVDRHTLDVVETCPDTNGSYGVSIDFDGYVWAVAGGTAANRVDPENCDVTTFDGLDGAYTYSDMTGVAVFGASGPEG